MTLHKPWILQPTGIDPDITYTAQEIRMFSTAIGTLTGNAVLTPADFNVTQRGAGANFSVDVAAGVCGVTGDDIASQGLYLAWNDATVNVSTFSTGGAIAAPGSGTRVHRLVMQIRDKLSNGTYTTYDALPQLLQDTGGGTPAEPASALTLALVSIAAGAVSITNANITNLAPSAQRSFITPSSQAFASTSDVNITGLAPIPVVARTYRLTANMIFQQGGGTPAFNVKIKGPAISSMAVTAAYSQENAGDTPVYIHETALNTAITSPAYAAARFFFLTLSGVVTFSAAGQLSLTGNTSTGGSMTLQAGSVLDLVPV